MKLEQAKLEVYRKESAEELYNFVKDYLEKNHPNIWNKIFHLILRDFRKDVEEIKLALEDKIVQGNEE